MNMKQAFDIALDPTESSLEDLQTARMLIIKESGPNSITARLDRWIGYMNEETA